MNVYFSINLLESLIQTILSTLSHFINDFKSIFIKIPFHDVIVIAKIRIYQYLLMIVLNYRFFLMFSNSTMIRLQLIRLISFMYTFAVIRCCLGSKCDLAILKESTKLVILKVD